MQHIWTHQAVCLKLELSLAGTKHCVLYNACRVFMELIKADVCDLRADQTGDLVTCEANEVRHGKQTGCLLWLLIL